MENTFGRGALRLASTSGQSSRDLGFILSTERIRFYDLSTGTPYTSLYEAAGTLRTGFTATGYVILDAWPSSPGDAFHALSLTMTTLEASTEKYVLQITQAGSFGRALHSSFSDLNLGLQFQTGQGMSIVAGSRVVLNLLDTRMDLNAALDANHGLHFVPATAATLNLENQVSLRTSGPVTSLPADRWNRCLAAYAFGEGSGSTARDISGSGTPLTLTTEAVPGTLGPNKPVPPPTWISGGIAFRRDVYLRSEAARLMQAIRSSRAFSFELWLRPQTGNQDGPAQILALRNPNEKNWFTLAQGEAGTANSFLNVDVRLDKFQKEWERPFRSPAGSLGSGLSHVVFTHDAEGKENIYINAELVATRFNPGVMTDWIDTVQLVLGADRQNDPLTDMWTGEMHHLAAYDRALSAEEVFRHYAPAFQVHGEAGLQQSPAPLTGVMVPAVMTCERYLSRVEAGGDLDRVIRPHLRFTHLSLHLDKTGQSSWTFSGTAGVQAWDSETTLQAGWTPDGRPEFRSNAGESVPVRLESLGTVPFAGLVLTATATDWTLSSATHAAFTPLPALLPADVAIDSDFKLLQPLLGLDAQDIRLEGHWLSAPLVLHNGTWLGKLCLNGETAFQIPFDLDLPAIIGPDTGALLYDAVHIQGETMQIQLRVQIQETGFMGWLNASFSFNDASGTRQTITLPERRLHTAPGSRNSLLGEILDQVQRDAHALLSDQGRHAADFYLAAGTDQPFIHLSPGSVPATTVSTTMPALFPENVELNSANGIFSLKQEGNESTLTLNLSAPDAAVIRADYQELMQKAAAAGIRSAGAVNVLRRRIAERLPLPYSDLLYYYCGWDADAGYLDLQGGMRLRVDFQNYQFVQASDPSARRGFSGSGSITIPVNTYAYPQAGDQFAQLTGFGPFLSQVQAGGRTDILNEGAGGLYDLLRDGTRKAFYRVFYPKQPSTGLGPERVVTFIGTDTWKEMLDVTRDFNPDGNLLPATGTSFFFRGKAMVLPEIQVFVRNQPVWVPLGTTIRQLAEMYDDVPAAGLPGQNLTAFTGPVRPLRIVHEGVDSKPEYRYLNPGNGFSQSGLDALDLPLIKGDRFYF